MKPMHTPPTVLPLSGAANAQWVVGVVLVAVLGGGVAQAQTTARVSVATGGAQGTGQFASISADGRYVAFYSSVSTLVAGDTNGTGDIFVRDRQSGTTERVSVDSGGAQANGNSSDPSISADGRFVAFWGVATNLVAGDMNGFYDVFVRDRQSGTTERVSVTTGGAEGNLHSQAPSISADGRFVAFRSLANNLVASDFNSSPDFFVRDRQSGTTELVSLAWDGAQAWFGVENLSAISADGRFVAFESIGANLVVGDTNGAKDVFVRDRLLSTTERVSVATGGAQGNGASVKSSISADGRLVAFHSPASTLVAGDTNSSLDIFVHDRTTGTTERVSVATGGAQGNGISGLSSISADGRFVAFESLATNLVAGDTNGTYDVFVHDRNASGFTSFCDPGVGGVIACPCSNAPSGPGRGCDNSSATGGASLTASGVAYLSSDSLVFTTSGEKPTATSIVLQGTSAAGAGLVFGQGVRCVAGTLKRLYTKTAVLGSITAPDFGAGDPSVSLRSTALGDTILTGESRWYTVYYRDPIVLGGCPAASTFNVTQSGIVTWWP